MAELISNLGMEHIVDKTGLAGKYNFHLETARPDMAGASARLEAALGEPNGPDIFEALEKQLGVKLEKKKVPFEVLVIDHVERAPTEN
jgi:uncharacterized protein (TIGR03435 family)